MTCTSCDIELSGEPFTLDDRPFCCRGCAEGGPCICSYRGDRGRYPRNGGRDPLAALFEEGTWSERAE